MDQVRQMPSFVGDTLYTQGQRRAFEVVAVHPNRDAAVLIRIHSTGKTRTISRREIEAGYEVAQRVPRGSLTAARLRAERASEYSPVYVLALLHAAGAA
jgi:hypothetical protein